MNIAIVGGGPAGAMAAIRLARAGAHVTIFDHSHSREKACGGGVTGRALALISDVIDVDTLPAIVVRRAVVEPATDFHDAAIQAPVDLIDRGLTPGSSLVVASRAIFDKALVDAAVAAGATLIEEKVVAISRGDTRFAVRTSRREYGANVLLGADGVNSLVRKTLARPFFRSELSVASGFFVHGISSRGIAIKSMAEQPGYLWSFPRPDHLAVGVCAPASERARSIDLRDQTYSWIRSHGLHVGAQLEPYAWPIPSCSSATGAAAAIGGPGWILLGDAAGLVDPLTREGIYYALLSGVWAAEALMSDPGRAHSRYESRVRAEIYPELKRAARLSGLFFSPRFASLFVTALQESGPIREVFRDLVAGTQPYKGLRRRLLRTREWKLAMNLVVQ